MAICPFCGKQINNRYRYCPQCGKAQPNKSTGVTELINGIQAELDRRMAQEDLEARASQAADSPEPAFPSQPQPEQPANTKEPSVPEASQEPQTPVYRTPNVSGLYEGYTPPEESYEEEEEDDSSGSGILRMLILLVSGLLIVAVVMGVLLILHPLGDGTNPADREIVEEMPTPTPTPKPTPVPTPEPTPEPEPEMSETEQMVYDVLRDYYNGYLTAINEQDMSHMVNASVDNLAAMESRVTSPNNAANIYAEDDFVLELDTDTLQPTEDGRIIVNVHLVFIFAPRAGGNSQTMDGWQTILLMEGTGDDGWIVDRNEYLSADGYAAHQYAFLP